MKATRVKLYSIPMSHPGHAVRLMLQRKRIEHDVKYLMTGSQPVALRALGFPRGTTPALKIDGRRIQGSREIAAALEEITPTPALFPADPEGRHAVMAAEEWAEREFQPVPRRLLRWGFTNVNDLRHRELVNELRRLGVRRIPASKALAHASLPLAVYFARVSGATEAAARADLERLPKLLRQVERMIEAGTIGGAEPNAADFQIGTTARLLYAFDDLRQVVEGTPAGELGMQVFPDFPHNIPPFLPKAWLQAAVEQAPKLAEDPHAGTPSDASGSAQTSR
jgi:glutathione S-transferase